MESMTIATLGARILLGAQFTAAGLGGFNFAFNSPPAAAVSATQSSPLRITVVGDSISVDTYRNGKVSSDPSECYPTVVGSDL
jgi:hypothetical protein